MSIAVLSIGHDGIPPIQLARTPEAKFGLHYDPDKPLPKRLVAVDQHAKGVLPLRKRIKSANLLNDIQGAWVLRRSVFEPIVAGVAGVILLPIEAHDAKGMIDDDWMLLHVTAVVALDRTATKFGKHPEGEGTKRQPLALGWKKPPTEQIFRLKEHRWITCAARPLFEQLHRASKNKIVEATPPYSHYQPAFYPLTF